MTKRILILGGTGDARGLADRLVAAGHQVTSSLAGVTAEPMMPAGDVRIGGFGGAHGLADYALSEEIDLIIDATHPYAAVISANAAEASAHSGVNLVRMLRPAWQAEAGDVWWPAGDTAEAVSRIEAGACAFVTIGRKEIGQFSARGDIRVVARMIEAPESAMPDNCKIILARPPFPVEDEIALMRDEEVSVLVSKNAGGPARAKLDAARALGVPVIMIERPAVPALRVVTTIEQAVAFAAEEGK
ncbi:MAG: cobalt-precorrin-6A reductase [Rhizobiales bacterium]|nr:cobalt-precorrin-6A reductase [Hyphomicrobiales bacterium]